MLCGLSCAETSNETIAGKSARKRLIGDESFCTSSVGTFMAMTHRSNAFFAHAGRFDTPGPVQRLRSRLWPQSRGGLGGHWHTRVRMPSALLVVARACAGKGDGDKAQRVALQIAFWVGPGHDPEYLAWLLSALMK